MNSFVFKFLCATLAACSAFAAPEPLSREEIAKKLWRPLHDLHGSTKDFVHAAEQMEREYGVSRSEIADVLLEMALDETTEKYPRKRSIGGFCEITPENEWNRLSPLYVVPDKHVRTLAQSAVLSRLKDLDRKFDYALERISALSSSSPREQEDVTVFSGHFSSILHYGQPTEQDREKILSFFVRQAQSAEFPRWAAATDDVLMRSDPSWSTNEARRAMMEKWKDDPNLADSRRALWIAALADFDRTNAAGHARETTGSSDGSPAEAATVGEPPQAQTKPIPAPAEEKPVAADGAPAEAPQEPNGSFSSWIAGAAALALAAAVVCLVVWRSRRR